MDDDGWADPPVPAARQPHREALRDHRAWASGHLGSWVGRRLRGESSGDGRSGKRPDLAPVDLVGGRPGEACGS